MNSFSLILRVNILGNALYIWVRKILTGPLGLTTSPLKMSGQEQIPRMGAVTGQINWFSAVCAADSKSQFREQFPAQFEQPRYWVTAHVVNSLWANTEFLFGYVPRSYPSHKRQKVLPHASDSQFSELLCMFQGRFLDEKLQTGIPTQTNTNLGRTDYLLEQNHKTLATFL